MIAVVPVRDGVLPLGGDEAVASAGGHGLLVGSGVAEAAGSLAGATRLLVADTGPYAPAAWAPALAAVVAGEAVVVLPASPDGRDLAPRLAHSLGRPLLAGAVRVGQHGASMARWGGLALEECFVDGPFVATLQPGVRGVEPGESRPTVEVVELALEAGADPKVLEVLPPDVTTMDLAEAARIVGAGAGLDGSERCTQLAEVAAGLGASMGATRVVTDRGWVGHERQIGTTGVVVAPRLYLAFGISGAVQHTSGLGQPDRIVSVNTDPHCPMMQLADLAVVADANAVIEALARSLEPRSA